MRKLLIVDDIALNRTILKRILCQEYEIIEACNGKEAIDILRVSYDSISAVLLDIVMPVMDGFAVLEEMRSDRSMSNIPVIVTTGSDRLGAEIQALTLGANDFIIKPYDPKIITHRLNNTIKLRETAAIINAARIDELTGLLTRSAFLIEAGDMIAEKEPGYYVMTCFDINGFKVINDQYGSAKGDFVLRYVADVFREGFCTRGGICSRITGDVFAILYPASEVSDTELAEIRRRASVLDGSILPMTYSIGRYVVNDKTLTASAMYDRAAIAKASVKGRFDKHIALYDESMRDHILLQQEVISEMNIALESGQFEPWYQPQYNHATGAFIGAEALVRWRHPTKGLISPAVFIPIFEKNGFIYELDKEMWRQVCRNLRGWLDQNRNPLPVSVNLSRYDLLRDDVVSVLNGLLDEYSLDRSLVRLEITESAFAGAENLIIRAVKQLRDSGFIIEIDDFGTGYSSLNTLKDVPADILKLDMRFVENNENSQRGGNILESVIRMAKWLGMSVIAEGVETRDQADFLMSIGCNYIQGYLYAKPMPKSEYEALARQTLKEEHLITLETVETLDNNAFWDPKSLDTLIFNSYVGGACIFEYHNDYSEMIRVNKKYAEELGIPASEALNIVWHEILDGENRKILAQAIASTIKTGKEKTCEFFVDRLAGMEKRTYIRCTLLKIASAGERALIYCTNNNITAQREAERMEHRIAEHMQAIMDSVRSGITASTVENGKVNILFANDAFYKMFGFTHAQFDDEVSNVFELLHHDDRKTVRDTLNRVLKSGKQGTVEYRSATRNGDMIWVSVVMSITGFEDVDGKVLISVMRDITAEKKAERELHETDNQLVFLNETAHELLVGEDTKAAINNVLEKTRRYFCGDRAYIFEYSDDGLTSDNTYEVCDVGVTSEINNLKNIPSSALDVWQTSFETNNFFCIEDVDSLPDNRSYEKEMLSVQGISSLISVPLRRNGRIMGFLAIDNPAVNATHADRLAAIGDYLAVMLTRRDMTAKIKNDNTALNALLNDMPGGYARMRVMDDGCIIPVYMNKGFARLVGMTPDEAMKAYGKSSFDGIHPDDLAIIHKTIDLLLRNGEIRSPKYRRLCKDGTYVTLVFFGRVVKNESGGTFINVFYSDYSDKNELEEQRTELLENLPCGAGIYEIENDNITLIYRNKRYFELVGRGVDEINNNKTMLKTVHPEDRQTVTDAIKQACRTGDLVEQEVRIKHVDGNYRMFHINGKVMRVTEGRSLIYATYTPISDDSYAYHKMLPSALGTLLRFSDEAFFIKDLNHRYMSCSSAFMRFVNIDDEKDIIGKTDYDILDEKRAKSSTDTENKIIASGNPTLNINETVRKNDGSDIYIKTSKYPLTDSAGKVIGIYCVMRDVTHYRTAFEQLKLLTDTIPGGISSFEIRNNKIKTLFVNDGFCAFFGYTKDEYVKKSLIDPFFMVYTEDKPRISEAIKNILSSDADKCDCEFRARTRSGDCRWISLRIQVGSRNGDTTVINTVQIDITESRNAQERLRISEEQFRIAASIGDRAVAKLDIQARVFSCDSPLLASQGYGKEIHNVPDSLIDDGLIAPESADDFRNVYGKLHDGVPKASITALLRSTDGGYRWFRIDATTVFDDDSRPSEAIMVFYDVTEQREKEAAYIRWQQSIKERSHDSYTLYRCNLSRNATLDSVEGSLLAFSFEYDTLSFDECTEKYSRKYVCDDDIGHYLSILNSDSLIAGFYRGKRNYKLEYREKQHGGKYRWILLTIELVEYPDSSDILAYLMYENIDTVKQAELLTKELASNDPLTGVLNRNTFSERMNSMLKNARADEAYALLMIDIDGFKLVNDSFGHSVGDETLTEIAMSLRSAIRSDDLIGRLGGDEFLICLRNIESKAQISATATRICASVRKSFSVEVHISASIGISLCPKDGTDFDELYRKSDAALYHIKATGKDGYAFYSEDMDGEKQPVIDKPSDIDKLKRRMLIVDDSRINRDILVNIFKNEFDIDTADSGNSALIRLRRYGAGISIVLLDIKMPGMDGFAVLDKMRLSPEMQSIPVVVVSGTDERETSLRAIKSGASDFVTKPVDADLLRLRVYSAISKSENEHLRAQNTTLAQISGEDSKYKCVIESDGTLISRYYPETGAFGYDPFCGMYISATFDMRPLWKLLYDDGAADEKSVKRLEKLINDFVSDTDRLSVKSDIMLKAPSGEMHLFRIRLARYIGAERNNTEILIALTDADN